VIFNIFIDSMLSNKIVDIHYIISDNVDNYLY